MKIIGFADKDKLPANYEINMQISLGPAFAAESLTRRELVTRLREIASRRRGGFLGQMYDHWADHIEAAAKHFKDDPRHAQRFSLDAPANLSFDASYGGEGSCDGCSLSHPGGSCCSCTHDDVTSCEPCG
jgi:hypothetical protein